MRDALEIITACPTLEARWLHTLSLLEFVGARKISRTVAQRHPSLDVLEHWSDETRHAAAFKRLALHEQPGELAPLAADAALTYFKSLDEQATRWLLERAQLDQETRGAYLLVTTLIERRAMRLYPLYRSLTARPDVQLELKQIILEEADHRRTIEAALSERLAQLGVHDDIANAQALEDDLFARFHAQLMAALSQAPGAQTASLSDSLLEPAS